jgi:sugar lactone lactonase YvrE
MKEIFFLNFNLDAKWKQQGITIVGGNGQGYRMNQLSSPRGIFIDDDQNLYIADCGNDRILKWIYHTKRNQIVAGGNRKGDKMNQLNCPTDVVIDYETNSFIIADQDNRRVIRWSRDNKTDGEIIISDIDCSRLAMDKRGSLYVSDWKKNEVRRWKRGEKGEGKIIAGGNGEGEHSNQLNHPTFIFVDEDDSLYVSDTNNHRVMKWVKHAKKGIIVAGGNGQGNNLNQLSSPQGVFVDQLGHIYVVDCGNHRVMRWYKDAREGRIIVGRHGEGAQ